MCLCVCINEILYRWHDSGKLKVELELNNINWWGKKSIDGEKTLN